MPEVVFSTGQWSCQRWSFGSQPRPSSLAVSVQVAYWLLAYALLHDAVVAMETAHLALNPYQAF